MSDSLSRGLIRALKDPPIYLTEQPARAATTTPWPEWVHSNLVRVLRDRGVDQPWSHQSEAASLAAAGDHVILATGTASGKSLAYQLPILTTLVHDPSATALYLAPTKALAMDQLRSTGDLVRATGTRDVVLAAYDGDTAPESRRWAREDGRWVFTNPDMLHAGILAGHERWGRLLRGLRYVVVDESHHYRGVFGSHVALVLRRLRRIAARHGADPTFVLASATMANPDVAASRLTGLPSVAVTDDGSPRAARTIAFWEPPVIDGHAGEGGAPPRRAAHVPQRRAAGAEAGRILADLVAEGVRTLAFVRSRRGAELTALTARRRLAELDPALADRVASYRGGYLAEDRRALEAALSDGTLLGVATTNALELGVDIAGLDAVVMAGFPGTVASFWQQAGRAGRGEGRHSLVVLVARDDPLDTYLIHHPAALLERPVEATVIDPTNPIILGPQLLCAAAELPLSDEEVHGLGGWEVLTEYAQRGLIRRREHGWFVANHLNPHGAVDIRGGTGANIAIVEADTGRMLGTVDAGRAHAAVHTGAVYLHRGETFVVDELDLAQDIALVRASEPGWTTTAREITSISVLETLATRPGRETDAALVRVAVTNQIVGYFRTRLTGEPLGVTELDLPPRTLVTRAVMYTLTPAVLARIGVAHTDIGGALHAAEHAAIGLLPLIATCDRWDIGGVSTALHPDTELPTVFVYDGHPGGAGFADRGYTELRRWLTVTRDTIESCPCPTGCPSCIQSPKCGNGNVPLDKAGAVLVLAAVVAGLTS